MLKMNKYVKHPKSKFVCNQHIRHHKLVSKAKMVVISGCSICQWEGFQSCTLQIWVNKIVDREISVDRTHICIHLLHQLIKDVDIC